MKERTGKVVYITVFLFIAVLVIFFSTVGGGVRYANAAASPYQLMFETRNVWDDLKGTTVDGEGIDLKKYNFDDKKNAQIISFVEFCYSPFTEKQGDYGLYVYVYNPRGYDWTQKPAMNKIQFRSGENTSSSYGKYALKYINRSTAAGYEGLFYKFKIVLSNDQTAEILRTVNSAERIYEVSGIELYDSGANATEYKVSATYRYTGYAKGYGPSGAATDTLKCTSDGLMTLTLDVHPTHYRPNGSNGSDEYTQDSLHSVYFSVPNDVLDEYGGLSAIHATWLNAVTAPYLVTGNKDIYNALLRYVGTDIGYNNSDVGYSAFGSYELHRIGGTNHATSASLIAYNPASDDIYVPTVPKGNERVITLLSGLFYASGGEADGYTVSSKTILQWLEEFTADNGAVSGGIYKGGDVKNGNAPSGGTGTGVGGGHGGGGGSFTRAAASLVLDKYSPALFEMVDDSFTDINISADDKYSLVSEKISQHWWQKIFGGSYVEHRTVFNNIEAIRKVEERDFKSDNTELICDRLYIDKNDYSEFKRFYDNAAKTDKTVFLFRYQISDYKAWEATEFEISKSSSGIDRWTQIDTNAYFFQETANLDFDVIDVTCTKGDTETVIACIASPQDIIHSATPPLNTKSDKLPWWAWLLIVVGVIVVVLVLLFVFFPGVFNVIAALLKGLWWLISAPFKAISAAVKKHKERKPQREAERQAKLEDKQRKRLEKEKRQSEKAKRKAEKEKRRAAKRSDKQAKKEAKKKPAQPAKKATAKKPVKQNAKQTKSKTAAKPVAKKEPATASKPKKLASASKNAKPVQTAKKKPARAGSKSK